jgi:uncharacterized membrane protein YkoI
MMKKWFRKVHRWLGVLMALQIIAWMASGLYFALFPIETIRGEHLLSQPEALSTAVLDDLVPPARAWDVVQQALGGDIQPASISLIRQFGKTWYRVTADNSATVHTRLVDARSGALMEFISPEQARDIAAASLVVPGEVRAVELLSEEGPPGSEYRGRALPLFRISYSEPEALNLYIDGWTGEVVARRTARWRVFDFLWMLHIMDFDERDDFNTPLLQVAAALGLLLALTGLVYWGMTTRLFRRGKKVEMPV